MDKPYTLFKNNRIGFSLLLLLPATLPAVLAILFFIEERNDPYWDFSLMLLAIAGLVCTLCCYVAIANVHHIGIDDEKLIAKSWLGYTVRTIFIKDITGWYELHKYDKENVYITLKLYTSTGSYTVNARRYDHYTVIKQKLTSGVPAAKEKLKREVRTGNRIEVAGLMLLVILCLFLAMPEFKDESSHDPLLLGSISGLLDSEPVITESGRSRTRSIEIRLKEYPEFEFVVNSIAMQVTDEKAFVSYAKRGYPMQLAIPLAHYEAKFAYLRQPTFWEKHTSYYTIPVAGFKDDQHTYLWPEKLAGLKTDFTVIRIMAVVGALYFIMLIIKKARASRY